MPSVIAKSKSATFGTVSRIRKRVDSVHENADIPEIEKEKEQRLFNGIWHLEKDLYTASQRGQRCEALLYSLYASCKEYLDAFALYEQMKRPA